MTIIQFIAIISRTVYRPTKVVTVTGLSDVWWATECMHCTLHLCQRWIGMMSCTLDLITPYLTGILSADYNATPDPELWSEASKFSINFLLGMSGISSRVKLILALAHSAMPNGLFNIWYPGAFFCFTHKASWECWPGSTFATWHGLNSSILAEERRSDREVLCKQSLLTMDTSQTDEMSWAIVELWHLRSRHLSGLSVGSGLSNENES